MNPEANDQFFTCSSIVNQKLTKAVPIPPPMFCFPRRTATLVLRTSQPSNSWKESIQKVGLKFPYLLPWEQIPLHLFGNTWDCTPGKPDSNHHENVLLCSWERLLSGVCVAYVNGVGGKLGIACTDTE